MKRRRSWFLQPPKREENSASHQDYAQRRKPKGILVLLRWGLDDNVTNVLYNLNQWISLGSGETHHGGGDLVVVNTAGLVGVCI